MAEEQSVKETKEAIIAAIALGKYVALRLKDGAGLDDAMALGSKLVTDAEFRQKLEAGAKDIEKSLAEVKNLSFNEGAELLQAVVEEWNKAA